MTSFPGSPGRQEIERIIALDGQPSLRNLRITQAYHDLSQSMASVIGDENVNWCTFATWASKTAGRFVRGEVAAMFRDALQTDSRLAVKLDRVNRLVRQSKAATRIDQLALFEIVKAPVVQVSQYVAAGNLAVFAELGPLFSELQLHLARDVGADSSSLARLLNKLDLKRGAPEEGGQALLRSAVTHFFEARYANDSNRKAELLLLANAETGLHEQIRLQPAIAGSLQLPKEAIVEALLEETLPGRPQERRRSRLREVLRSAAKPLTNEIHQELSRLWRNCATRVFMTLGLPGGDIHLGKDVRNAAGRDLFPAALQTIEMTELQDMLMAYGAGGSTAVESGALDWADLAERMHFILILFRARQQDRRLFDQPFSDAQRRAIAAGYMPQGAL